MQNKNIHKKGIILNENTV